MAEDSQHEHQPAGRSAAAVVVGDDGRAVTDAQTSHRRGERVGGGQRVAAFARRLRVVGQVGVEVDEPRSPQVLGLEGGAARPSVEVPTHVGQHDGLPQARQVRRGDDRIDHAIMFARVQRAE